MELFNNAIRLVQIIKENLKKQEWRCGNLALWHYGRFCFIQASNHNAIIP